MDRALSTLKLRGKSSKDLSAVATCTKEYPTDPACYELLEDCGRGVSATVHRALCKSNGEVVAVKKMNLERVSMTLDEIIHEAQTMKSYNHPNVLPLYTSFVHGQDLWMVTPFMAGGSVLHIMKYQFSEGLDEVVIATIMKYVLQGLEYVHKNGGIHRDVKAGNILIDRDGTVRIGDFGVAATIERGGSWGNDKMVRTTFVGTPCWMAPEVMEQTQGYDSSADIWSFGITMLELANGHAPFAKFPPMKVLLMTLQNPPPQLDDKQGRKHFSKQMRNLVARCLQKDPRSRPSATELLQDKFFKQARDEEFLRQALMTGIPNLGERVQQIRVGKAATTAADNDKQLERSQEEYVKGVSSWNFDLAALKAQAASEPDDGSVPQTPTFPAMPTIMEGPEAVEGEGSGEGSRRSTDDAAAVPMTPVVSPTTSAGGAGVLVQQQPVQVAQQQQGQQQQMAVQEMVAVVQQQTVAVQQQQQLGSMQQPIVQVTQQQTVAVQQQLDVGVVASQLQQQQQQSNAANMRRASSAFAGSTALAAAAAAASASIHPAAAAVGHAQLQGHFSEPAAVVLSQQQSATAAINIMGGTSGGSSYCVSPLNGSPPMSRESSSQGPLGALAATPENISLKGKSKGRHGRFQVYEHGEEPPPMSPPANKALHEGLSGSFSRAVDGRLSDPAAEAPAIAASSTKQTPEIEGLLAAAVAGHVSAGPPVAPLCNGSGPAHHVPGGVVIGFAAGTDGGAAAADGGAVPGSGSATPPLPPAGPSTPVAGLAVSGTLSEGLDATGTTEPKKRGRFKIIEEEPSVSSKGSSVSKVPSSADLGKSSALRGALTGPGVMLELQKLHEQAINHQQALGGLIDRMKVGGSLGNLASAGEEGSTVAAVSAAGVARKLSNTGSLSRSTSNKTLGGGLDLRQLTLHLMLPAYDNSMEEVAEKLLERGQDLERRLSEVLEENQRLRLKLALSDAGVGVGVYGGGDSFGGSGAAGAGSSSNMAAILAAGLRSELGDGSNQLSRPVSRRASAANQGIPSNPGFSGQQQQQGATAAAAGSGLSSGGGQGVAGGGLGDRYSSGGASADSNGSSAAAAAAAASGVGGDGAARGNGSSINEAVGAAAGAVDAATPAGAGPAAGAGSLARDSVAAMFWKG